MAIAASGRAADCGPRSADYLIISASISGRPSDAVVVLIGPRSEHFGRNNNNNKCLLFVRPSRAEPAGPKSRRATCCLWPPPPLPPPRGLLCRPPLYCLSPEELAQCQAEARSGGNVSHSKTFSSLQFAIRRPSTVNCRRRDRGENLRLFDANYSNSPPRRGLERQRETCCKLQSNQLELFVCGQRFGAVDLQIALLLVGCRHEPRWQLFRGRPSPASQPSG